MGTQYYLSPCQSQQLVSNQEKKICVYVGGSAGWDKGTMQKMGKMTFA